MGKIIIYDKIIIKNRENMEIKDIFT